MMRICLKNRTNSIPNVFCWPIWKRQTRRLLKMYIFELFIFDKNNVFIFSWFRSVWASVSVWASRWRVQNCSCCLWHCCKSSHSPRFPTSQCRRMRRCSVVHQHLINTKCVWRIIDYCHFIHLQMLKSMPFILWEAVIQGPWFFCAQTAKMCAINVRTVIRPLASINRARRIHDAKQLVISQPLRALSRVVLLWYLNLP